jgi:hypothetical protein
MKTTTSTSTRNTNARLSPNVLRLWMRNVIAGHPCEYETAAQLAAAMDLPVATAKRTLAELVDLDRVALDYSTNTYRDVPTSPATV